MYLLWGFENSCIQVITRGRDQNEAYSVLSDGVFKRGETIVFSSSVPINAAELYSQNHQFDWLNTTPYKLQERNK